MSIGTGYGTCPECGGDLTTGHICPQRSRLQGEDVSALKIKIARLESANRSLLDRIAQQAEVIRTIDGMLEAGVLKAKVAAGMMEGTREYIRDKGIEEITLSGLDVD